MKNETIILIAREKIEKGDIVMRLWKRYCRRCTADKLPCGFTMQDIKKNKSGEILLCQT